MLVYDTTILVGSIPTSDATNLLDLLEDLYTFLKEQPKRFKMSRIKTGQLGDDEAAKGPLCGTVGCYGAWLGALLGSPGRSCGSTLYILSANNTCNQTYQLFSDLFYNIWPQDRKGNSYKYGTPQYSRFALRRLRRFIDDNRALLRKTPVNRNACGV